MKILVVSQYFFPENFRINDVCFELVNKGHNVTVLTGMPNYPDGLIYPGYENSGDTSEIINGVKVIRAKIRPRKSGAINLLRNYISFKMSASKKISKLEKFDLVYVYGLSPVSSVYPGIKCAKRQNIPLVLNCLDLWPESIKVLGFKESSLPFKVVKKYSLYIYSKPNSILIPSPRFKNYLVETCKVPAEKINVLYNHAENEYLNCTSKKIDDKLHLLFAGNIGKAQNLEILIEAVSVLDSEIKTKIVVDIVGDGSHMSVLKELVSKYKLGNVFVFHGKKSLQDVIEFYNIADACILTLENNNSIAMTIPAKLQSYMASAKPIIASGNGGARDLIEKANCGIVCDANDSKQLSIAIADFITNSDTYRVLGENGRKYFIEHFTLEQHVTQLEEYLRGV